MSQRGFTMIELTTVGIIILILICIALPNFLEARIRAYVAASHSEMALVAQCLEEYYIAHRAYPPNRVEKTPDGGLSGDGNPNLRGSALLILTTPTVYLSELVRDQFHAETAPRAYYDYINFSDWTGGPVSTSFCQSSGSAAYALIGLAPNLKSDTKAASYPPTMVLYGPTNGTLSQGDLLLFGP
jgi:prepilin-type N-terminal cleavage/methylation domain-containing protein